MLSCLGAGNPEEGLMVRCGFVRAAAGLAAVVLIAPVAAGAGPAQKPSNAATRCHFVKKKVHGKVRKLRVCKKKKPAPTPAAKLVAQATLDGQITEIADGFGSLWARVVSGSSGTATVERIDPANLNITARISAGTDVSQIGSPVGLAVGDGAVWVPNHDANTLLRIDPGTNSVAATISLPDVGAHAVTTSPGAVWVGTEGASGKPGVVARIDPATNKVVATIVTPGSAGVMDLAFGAGALWAEFDSGAGRFDPASNSLSASIVLPQSPVSCGGLAADDSAVWVAPSAGCFGRGGSIGGLAKINPSTNAVSTLSVGRPEDVAIGLGSLWTPDADAVLRRFNESTGALEGTLPIHTIGGTVVAVANGDIWVGDANGTLLELAPS
jgi:hypothetical protein